MIPVGLILLLLPCLMLWALWPKDPDPPGTTPTSVAAGGANGSPTAVADDLYSGDAESEDQTATARAETETAGAQDAGDQTATAQAAEEQTANALIEEQTATAMTLAEEQTTTAQMEEQTATAQAQEQTAIAFATATAQAEPIMVFASYRNNQSDIYTINTARELQQLTNDPANDNDPAWSPDGTQVVLESGNQIFVMNANGSNQQRLTNTGNKKNNHDPDWSPRNEIAFQTNRDGNWEIYVMNADGSNLRNLTNTPQINEVHPAWSPDGSNITFAAHPKGKKMDARDIYVMNSAGTSRQQLTNEPLEDSLPCWSPDGQQIAFTSKRDGESGAIYVINVNGTPGSEYRLTDQSGWHCSWSSDGRIAFSCDNRICAVNEDGGNLEYLTEPGGDLAPSWWPPR